MQQVVVAFAVEAAVFAVAAADFAGEGLLAGLGDSKLDWTEKIDLVVVRRSFQNYH